MSERRHTLWVAAALLPVVLSALALGAHFLRAAMPGLALLCVASPLLLLLRRRWVAVVLQLFLLAGIVIWLQTAHQLVLLRLQQGLPWLRVALILGGAALLAAGGVVALQRRALRGLLDRAVETRGAGVAVFVLVFGLLAVVQLMVPRPMLLAQRLLPGTGWIEVLALAAYGAVICEKLLDPKRSPRWRRRLWWIFSVVFFAQLAAGLCGLESFLMTPGKLHLPVPALILAGPLYRGERFLMPMLFGSTLLLVGPAWCSHLCYLGVWDSATAGIRPRPARRHAWHAPGRVLMLALVAGGAVGLRLVGAPVGVAFGLALALGLGGLAVMLLLSRRSGSMVHCTVWCPVGLVANLLGRLSPFRLRMASGCDGCARCRLRCRFEALEPHHIERRRPGLSCTLCGDCLGACEGGFLQYRLAGLDPENARTLFVVLVSALHAAVLGLARI